MVFPRLSSLKYCHNNTPLAELQKHAAFRIGFGQLRKKGLVRVNNGVVSKTAGASTAEDETALKSPESGGERTRDLIRRGILQETESVRNSIAITPEGMTLAKRGLDMREEIGTLSRDQILSGAWKTLNLRRYDVSKLPEEGASRQDPPLPADHR